MNPGRATRPPSSSFSAARASGSASTSARVPTAAIKPSRTSSAPSSINPRFEREAPRRGPLPRKVKSCDAPVMRRESGKTSVLYYAEKLPTSTRGTCPACPEHLGDRVGSLCIGFSASAGGLTLKRRQKHFLHECHERRRRRIPLRPRLQRFHVSAVDRRGHLANQQRHVLRNSHPRHCLDHLLIRQLHVSKIRFPDRCADNFCRFGVSHVPRSQQFLRLLPLEVQSQQRLRGRHADVSRCNH